jgi:hypothetical protein
METLIPSLSESAIKDRFDRSSWQKSETYFQQGFSHLELNDMTISGRCQGQLPRPYRVQVTFNNRGIDKAECSCPVGDGGYCKHTAALLRTWIKRPNQFTVHIRPSSGTPDVNIETRLSGMVREELIALVTQIFQLHPELTDLVTLRPVDPTNSIDTKAIYERIEKAILNGDDAAIDRVLSIGTEYFDKKQNYQSAQVVLSVAKAIIDHKDEYGFDDDDDDDEDYDSYYGYDDDDDEDLPANIETTIRKVAEQLGKCLPLIDNSKQRQSLLGDILDLYLEIEQWDIDNVFTSLLFEGLQESETRWLARRVRDKIGKEKDRDQVTILQEVLFRLEYDQLGDDEFIQLARATQHYNDMIERMFSIGQADQAIKSIRSWPDYLIMPLLPTFAKHNASDRIEPVIKELVNANIHSQLRGWLVARYLEQGDTKSASELNLKVFQERPSLDFYRNVHESTDASLWPDLHTKLLAELQKKRNYSIIVDIALDEKDYGLALATLHTALTTKSTMPDYFLRAKVADAIQKDRPEDAIRLYLDEIQMLIEQRGRGPYAAAAQHLKKVHALYKQLELEPVWDSLITRIKDDNRRLTAFIDELRKAKV